MNQAKFKMMSFLFGIPLLLSGCIVQSLHPLYTDENVIFDTCMREYIKRGREYQMCSIPCARCMRKVNDIQLECSH